MSARILLVFLLLALPAAAAKAKSSSRRLSVDQRFLDTASVCQGRLTLTSGTAVTVSDLSSQGTLYFTPKGGNKVSVYDGSVWKLFSFTELSISLASISSGSNYDVFVYNNSGNLALELSAAWTGNTTRNEGVSLQDGVYVKTSTPTRRYLGTIRGSGAGVTADTTAKRFVWNYYNRVRRPLYVSAPLASWSYITLSWRPAANNSANMVETVVGIAEVYINLRIAQMVRTTGYFYLAICEDCASASTGVYGNYAHWAAGAGTNFMAHADFHRISDIGYHYYAWNEMGSNSGVTVWQGGVEGTLFGHIDG